MSCYSTMQFPTPYPFLLVCFLRPATATATETRMALENQEHFVIVARDGGTSFIFDRYGARLCREVASFVVGQGYSRTCLCEQRKCLKGDGSALCELRRVIGESYNLD
jgi:hypothetical protein